LCVFTDTEEEDESEQRFPQNQSDIVQNSICDSKAGGQSLSPGPNSGIKVTDVQPEHGFNHTLPSVVVCTLPGKESTDSTPEVKQNFESSNHLKDSETSLPSITKGQISILPSNQSTSAHKEPERSETKTLISNWQQSWARFGFKTEPKEEPNSSSLEIENDLLAPTRRNTTEISTSCVKIDHVESIDDRTAKPETLLNPRSDENAGSSYAHEELPLGNKTYFL